MHKNRPSGLMPESLGVLFGLPDAFVGVVGAADALTVRVEFICFDVVAGSREVLAAVNAHAVDDIAVGAGAIVIAADIALVLFVVAVFFGYLTGLIYRLVPLKIFAAEGALFLKVIAVINIDGMYMLGITEYGITVVAVNIHFSVFVGMLACIRMAAQAAYAGFVI